MHHGLRARNALVRRARQGESDAVASIAVVPRKVVYLHRHDPNRSGSDCQVGGMAFDPTP
jgi:hypothetical protein